jgi:hypothetical protein
MSTHSNVRLDVHREAQPAYNLLSTLSWAEVAKLCLEYGADAAEVAGYRFRQSGAKLRMSDIWPIFASDDNARMHIHDDIIQKYPQPAEISRIQRLIYRLGEDLERLLEERNALTVDMAADREKLNKVLMALHSNIRADGDDYQQDSSFGIGSICLRRGRL